eukprot:m.77002 g.77002  ORF g.77002 m.77002 type:complete len:165 (+) comp50475_c1_seq1:4409-4903(+)
MLRLAAAVLRCKRAQHTTPQYMQGQQPFNFREYFYYLDYQGFLYLDDAKIKNFTSCFKDKVFLDFFFERIKPNQTGQYQDTFPFISLCGRERNFLRVDDTPIVFHTLQKTRLIYAGTLGVTFDAQLLEIGDNGRLYYPSPAPQLATKALIGAHLALQLGKELYS